MAHSGQVPPGARLRGRHGPRRRAGIEQHDAALGHLAREVTVGRRVELHLVCPHDRALRGPVRVEQAELDLLQQHPPGSAVDERLVELAVLDPSRELLAEAQENNDRRARLAIDIFCYRARKYIGSYLAALGGSDAIVFAGGIGENAPEIRAEICRDLGWAGVALDEAANTAMVGGKEGRITTPESRLAVWVIPTDEELLIARDTFRAVSGAEGRY